MEEIRCKQVATLRGGKWEKTYEESRRVYGIDGLSPTVHTQGGGNQEVKILVEPLAYDEQNGYLREDGIVGTLTTDGSSPKHNNRVVEPITTRGSDVASTLRASMHKQGGRNLVENIKNGRGYEGVLEPIVYDGFNQKVREDSGVIGTITRNVGADLKRNGQGLIEPKGEYELSDKMKRYINSYDDKYKVSDGNLTINKEVAPAVTTREGCSRADQCSYIRKDFDENANVAGVNLVDFRVRKLTEKECFRLMGVKDEDFEKVRKNQSKSSCYHLAGDSIVSTVLMALFGNMMEIDWRKKVNNLTEELANGTSNSFRD